MRPRPAATVITHGFPVGELDAASSPTGKPWVITRGMSGSCARASLARAQLPTSRPAAPRSTPQQSLLRRGSRRCRSSSDRSRTGNYRFESAGRGRSAASSGGHGVITHGFPVGELDAASSPTGKRVGDHRGDVGQLRAGESRPRATARHRDRQRRDPRRSSHCCGVDRRCRSSSDRSRTGNYRFESAGRGRSAASSGGRVITHGFPVGELDAASSPTGKGDPRGDVGQLRAGESRPRATARHRDRPPRSTPQQSLLRRGSVAAGPHPIVSNR